MAQTSRGGRPPRHQIAINTAEAAELIKLAKKWDGSLPTPLKLDPSEGERSPAKLRSDEKELRTNVRGLSAKVLLELAGFGEANAKRGGNPASQGPVKTRKEIEETFNITRAIRNRIESTWKSSPAASTAVSERLWDGRFQRVRPPKAEIGGPPRTPLTEEQRNTIRSAVEAMLKLPKATEPGVPKLSWPKQEVWFGYLSDVEIMAHIGMEVSSGQESSEVIPVVPEELHALMQEARIRRGKPGSTFRLVRQTRYVRGDCLRIRELLREGMKRDDAVPHLDAWRQFLDPAGTKWKLRADTRWRLAAAPIPMALKSFLDKLKTEVESRGFSGDPKVACRFLDSTLAISLGGRVLIRLEPNTEGSVFFLVRAEELSRFKTDVEADYEVKRKRHARYEGELSRPGKKLVRRVIGVIELIRESVKVPPRRASG